MVEMSDVLVIALDVLSYGDARVRKLELSVTPFSCTQCRETYVDFGPLFVVTLTNGTEQVFCSDSCVVDAGLPEVVAARERFEFANHGIAISYTYPLAR
jgi:hypothetical protein